MRSIPIYQPYLHGNEQKYVQECLSTSWISSRGSFIQKFEQAFSDTIKAPYVTSVSNGTVALHLALVALGIGPGDEVIVPTLTYVASVNTILQIGAKPVFVDVVPDSWQIDPEDVAAKITEKTKAIMAVHLYGAPADLNSLVKLCKSHQCFLIEDCAEAFGSQYRFRHVGTFGDVATFSFFGNKTITTGEGGMVVCQDEQLWKKMCRLKTQGLSLEREYWHDQLGYNYRMTNICAAIGLAQLEKSQEILAKKRKIAKWYEERLKSVQNLVLHTEEEGTVHSFWMCSMLVNTPVLRDQLREHLKKKSIETRPLFYPVHTFPHCFVDKRFPVSERLSALGLNLPSYPDLLESDLDFICGTIQECLNSFEGERHF